MCGEKCAGVMLLGSREWTRWEIHTPVSECKPEVQARLGDIREGGSWLLAGLESTVISGSERPKLYTFGETETIGLTVGQAEELKLRP